MEGGRGAGMKMITIYCSPRWERIFLGEEESVVREGIERQEVRKNRKKKK